MAGPRHAVNASRVRFLAGLALLASACPAAAGLAGAGFFITADGYLVTSFEVVADAEPVLIRVADGGTLPARIVATDPVNGLALLKAEGSFAAIPIAPSAQLKAGDPVFVMKRGHGDAESAILVAGTAGAASGDAGVRNALRVSVPAGPGESGGPLLTAGGDAVAVIIPARRGGSSLPETGAYAVRSESLLTLVEAEQPAWAQLRAPGAEREAGELERAVVSVFSGQPESPAAAQQDGGELVATEMFRIGNRARQEQDYLSARRWLLEAAVRGHAPAQTALAGLYSKGQGVAPDDAEAATWYRAAALQGDPEAQARLGWMYTAGAGVVRDDDQALAWLHRATEQGNAAGQNALGVMYRDGRGVYRDDARAANWFRLAALQGDPAAQANLGAMFRDGRGVEQDPAEAVWWFRRAAEQRDAEAQAQLGLMYREGRGVRHDEADAVRWLRRAAEQGHALAQYQLGVSYAEGRGVSGNRAEAAGWLERSAHQGYAPARDYLKRLKEEGD